MAEQERAKRTSGRKDQTVDESGAPASAAGEEIADKIDGLLEEIDAVLEENAEEFVKNYVQKGGQ
ncbi:MAG: ubiquitin-like protein Pup [Actinomycetota bacterium]